MRPRNLSKPNYTNDTFEQGDRVKAQLEAHLDTGYCSEFEYQGSVTCDTHVKHHSDIDLLLLHGVYTLYPYGHPIEYPVSAEVVTDSLMDLRKDSVGILKARFPKVTVDESGSKAVALRGGSLTRDVDVVFCHWWNTQEYLANKVRANRGIQVLDAFEESRIGNKPFLHNWHINDKDVRVGGGLRKAIRLLKTLKYDKKPTARISSYDIAALCFKMDESELNVPAGAYLRLARNTSVYLHSLIGDTQLRESLFVPNGTRRIFGEDGASLASLKEITVDLDSLLGEISVEASRQISLSESVEGFRKTAAWNEVRARRVQEVTNKFMQAD